MFFKGWGTPEFMDSCTSHRASEMKTGVELLRAINGRGSDVLHLTTSCRRQAQGAAVLDALQGRLHLESLALVGHSYGGGTVASTYLASAQLFPAFVPILCHLCSDPCA
jgi:predicted dienelactone hydrolase